MTETTADYFSPKAFERACDKSGLTRKEIARLLGVTPTSMSNVTSGRTTPSLKLLTRMVEVFGGSLSDYLALPAAESWKLQHFRVAHGYTQADLAKRVGVSRQVVSNWEVGKVPPSETAAEKLSELYGVSAERIREVSGVTAALAPIDKEKAAAAAATLELAEQVLAYAEEANQLAWSEGVTDQERTALFAQITERVGQALTMAGTLIPQLSPARRVSAYRLVKRLTDVFEEVSEI